MKPSLDWLNYPGKSNRDGRLNEDFQYAVLGIKALLEDPDLSYKELIDEMLSMSLSSLSRSHNSLI